MKRRGLFSFMAAAPIGMVGAVGASAAQSPKEKPPKDVFCVSFCQPKNVKQTNSSSAIFISESEPHGKLTMYNHHLWVYNNKIDDWELVK